MMNLPQQKRRRGVLLTPQGLHKLQTAKQQAENDENDAKPFTLESLTTRTGLDSHTLGKILNRTIGVDRRSLARCFLAFSLFIEPGDYELYSVSSLGKPDMQALQGKVDQASEQAKAPFNRLFPIAASTLEWPDQACNQDGSLPNVSAFYGRGTELECLNHWIRLEGCRFIALTGQGGIGKTSLAAKLVKQMQGNFEPVFWRSLQMAPSLTELLSQLIQFISGQAVPQGATRLNELMTQAIDCLRSSRCLLVLDNVETILQSYAPAPLNQFAGQYGADYEAYQLFFKRVLETNHQSTIVLTSRELPQEIKQRVSHDLSIRSLRLKGLTVGQIQKLLHHLGAFQGTLVDWIRLTHSYSGNPLMLKSVGQSIQTLFGGNISAFLKQDIVFFDEVCELLNQQLRGLSDTELDFMSVLAGQSKPVSFSEMRSQIAGHIPSPTLLAGLNSLDTRSLLEVRDGQFFLQPLIAHYIQSQAAMREL